MDHPNCDFSNVDNEHNCSSRIKVEITKIVDPTTFWAHLYHESKSEAEKFSKFVCDLNDHCNHHSTPLADESCFADCYHFKRGDIVAIRTDNCWNRGRFEGELLCSTGYLLQFFLVDTGETVIVNRTSVRLIPKCFHNYPFQAIKLELPNLYPYGLCIDARQNLTVFQSVLQVWDSSAKLYVEKLLRDQVFVEVKLLERRSDNNWDVLLYCYVNGFTDVLCLNQVLVTNKFAAFLSPDEYETALDLVKSHTDLPSSNVKLVSASPEMVIPSPKRSELHQPIVHMPSASPEMAIPSPKCSELYQPIVHIPSRKPSETFSANSVSPSPSYNQERSSSEKCYQRKNSVTDCATGSAGGNPGSSPSIGRGRQLLQKLNELKNSNMSSKSPSNLRNMPLVNSLKSLQFHDAENSYKSLMDDFADSSSIASLPETECRNMTVVPSKSPTQNLNEFTFNRLRRRASLTKSDQNIAEKSLVVDIQDLRLEACESVPNMVDTSSAEVTAKKPLNRYENSYQKYQSLTSKSTIVSPKEAEKSTRTEQSAIESEVTSLNELSANSLVHPDYVEKSYYHNEALVYGESIPQPVFEVQQAMFDPHLKKRLKQLKLSIPKPVQSHAWPSVLRLRHVTVIGASNSGKTLSYLLPLVSLLMCPVTYTTTMKQRGPRAVIFCSKAKTARRVFDTLRLILSTTGSTDIRVTIVDRIFSKLDVQIASANDCRILITTPHRFMHLLKADQKTNISFSCLSHLILEEGHLLFEEDTCLMEDIMKHIVKHIDHLKNPLWQIIVCSERWTSSISSFMQNCMSNPIVFFSSLLEAAVYTDVRIQTHMCRTSFQDTKLQEIVAQNKPKKTVICTASTYVAIWIHEMLKHNHRTLLIDSKLDRYQLDVVNAEWKSLDKNVILVIADDSLHDCNVTDASCLIHYDLPIMSKTIFANRFHCVLDQLKRLSCCNDGLVNKKSKDYLTMEKPILLHVMITEKCNRQAPALCSYLERFQSMKPPTDLKEFALGCIQGREETSLNLCTQWKEFGRCMRRNLCSFRHTVRESDAPLVPADGEVQVLIMHVASGTRYYGRIMEHTDAHGVCHNLKIPYLEVWQAMQDYYLNEEHRLLVGKAEIGDLCALHRERENDYYRVKVIGQHIGDTVSVTFVDNGRESLVKVSQLLKLPDELRKYPFQSVEIFACNLKPIDNMFEWEQGIIEYVKALVFGNTLTGKVQLALNSTLWLQPLAKMKYLDHVKTSVRDFSVGTKLKEHMFAADYRLHLETLREMCDGKLVAGQKKIVTPPINVQPPVSLQYLTLQSDALERVKVTNVQSPGCFHVHKKEFSGQLSELKNEMSTKKSVVSCENITKNQIYRVYFPEHNKWIRGRIEDAQNDGRIMVYNVDYGGTSIVSKDFVKILPEELVYEMPAQAIECSLFGVEPLSNEWLPESICAFSDLVLDLVGSCDLVLKVMEELNECHGHPRYSVLLYALNGFEEKLINAELVNKGYAKLTSSVVDKGWLSLMSSEGLQSTLKPDSDLPSCDDSSNHEGTDDQSSDLACFIEDQFSNAACVVEDQSSNTICPIEDQSSNTVCPIEDQFSDTVCPIEDQSSNAMRVIKDQSVNVASNNEDNSLSDYIYEESSYNIMPTTVKWFQSKSDITLKFQVHDINDYVLDVNESTIQFRTLVGPVCYMNNFELYSEVLPQEKTETPSCSCLTVVIKKALVSKWPRLMKLPSKFHWLHNDFDHIDLSSDDEDSQGSEVVLTSNVKSHAEDVYRRTDNDEFMYNSDTDSTLSEISICSD